MIKKQSANENMNIVIVGHVDHGKSTVIGRLLADTNSLPEGKLQQVKETCRRNAKPFEYAFLLDALKEEQAQGITIDAARVFFKTAKRKYIIIDAPGHIEFLKNMVTGAARAEAALLVIDAQEGVMENSKRHGYLLSMLGIKQVVVLVNKMDLIDFDQVRYREIVAEYMEFLAEIGVEANSFIPVSGFQGDNVAHLSRKMPWYNGSTVLEQLDLFESKKDLNSQVFRMPVQSIYKFTAGGDNRRIVAGTIETGRIKTGDEVVFYPSGKRSKVKSIERFNAPEMEEDTADSATGFTLEEQIYVIRGELACVLSESKPEVSTRIKTKLFWLGKDELNNKRNFYIKVGTQKVRAVVEEVVSVLDASTLSRTTRQNVLRHEVAEVNFKLEKEIAFDKAENLTGTSRFVLIDDYEISGGGIIVDKLSDVPSQSAEPTYQTKRNRPASAVTKEERAVRYAQKPAAVIIAGTDAVKPKEVARFLERRLFFEGRNVYYLGENASSANVLIDAGSIVILSVNEKIPGDVAGVISELDSQSMKLVWVGPGEGHDLPIDLQVEGHEEIDAIYLKIKKLLSEAKIVFEPGQGDSVNLSNPSNINFELSQGV